MENQELITCADGSVNVRTSSGDERKVTQLDRELIEFILSEVKDNYPKAYERLCNLYARYKGNRMHYEYRMAIRFIKCNMGADDLLSMDIHHNVMHFERINCPLRGECNEEGIVCCPKAGLKLSPQLRTVATMYAVGKSPADIAILLSKSVKTINNELGMIKKCLNLKRVRDIIPYALIYNL